AAVDNGHRVDATECELARAGNADVVSGAAVGRRDARVADAAGVATAATAATAAAPGITTAAAGHPAATTTAGVAAAAGVASATSVVDDVDVIGGLVGGTSDGVRREDKRCENAGEVEHGRLL